MASAQTLNSQSFLPINHRLNDASIFLDFLRTVASWAVVIGHGVSSYGVYSFLDYPSVPYIQNIAVVLFFLLSGFLIAHTLRKNSTRDDYRFSHFLIDRVARIYSVFLPALFFVLIVDSWLAYKFGGSLGARHTFATFVGNVLMLQDAPDNPYLTKLGLAVGNFGSGPQFWTVAVEMWIYLFVGSLYLFRRPTIPQIILIIFFGFIPMSHLYYGRGGGLFLCWLLGALSEHVIFKGYLSKVKSWILLSVSSFSLIIYILKIMSAGKEVYVRHSYPWLFLTFTMLVAFLLRTSWSVNRSWLKTSVKVLSGYTFTLYATHYTTMSLLSHLYPGNKETRFWLLLIVSNGVAFSLAWFTEHRYKQLALFLKEKLLGESRKSPLPVTRSLGEAY